MARLRYALLRALLVVGMWARGSRCPDGKQHPRAVLYGDGSLHCARCGAEL